MKIFSHLYRQTISIENLLQAWEEFKKGKRKKPDVGEFERHLEDNLFSLHEELSTKKYHHGEYLGFYISDPKVRHIHKATVKDRIVHHALFLVLNPIFEPTFISDSYSCRKGYGTHRGFQKLVFYARKISKNYTKDCWALKCDIKKFFDSVDHEILLAIIEKRVKDNDMLWLLREIIKSYEVLPDKGIPIGNLTSQLFANIYLNEFDQFIKNRLCTKYYLRYTDDFILLSLDKNILEIYRRQIDKFLGENLYLTLHPNKTVFRKLTWGVDFLGYVALPYYQVLRTKTKKRIFRKVAQRTQLYRQNKLSKESLHQSLVSYLGVLRHANTYKLENSLRNNIFFWMSSFSS